MATKQLTPEQAKECCAEQKKEIDRLKNALVLIQNQNSLWKAIRIACDTLGDPPPLGPADFLDALQDRVHREVGKSRPGRSFKAKPQRPS